jgi:hypothetical protein
MRNLPVRWSSAPRSCSDGAGRFETGSFALADTEWKPAVEALTSPAGATAGNLN